MFSFDQIFAAINFFISLVFVVLLTIVLVKSNQTRAAKTFLILLMLCRILTSGLNTLIVDPDFLTHWPFFYRSTFPFELLSPVLIYLYIMAISHSYFSWRNIRWYHALPLLLGLAWYLVGPALDTLSFSVDKYLRTGVVFFVMIPYLWTVQKNISELQSRAEDQRSSIAELHLPWLRFLLGVCYLALIFNFIDLMAGPNIPLYAYTGLITNLGLIGLTYYGLESSDLFQQDETLSLPEEAVAMPTSPAPNPEELALLGSQLQTLLKEKQLFLRPQIRLSDIADEMGIKSYKLSEVIRHGLNTTFYDLINGLRIEYSMQLMRDPTKDHMNLLGIAMDSGFNSKSVFNDYFKKKTSMTPSEFRQQELTIKSTNK